MSYISYLPYFSGISQDGKQRAHKSEGSRSGWICGAVQDQKTHAAHQTHEGLLRETGGRGSILPHKTLPLDYEHLGYYWLTSSTSDSQSCVTAVQ